jgi:hypothetical protein
VPSATALIAAPSASATSTAGSGGGGGGAPAGPALVPFEVRPVVQVKHKTDGERVWSVVAEPGVLVGPKKTLIKAFDCVSKGTPRPDMFGVCVGFHTCEAETPSEPSVLAAITCTGPTLHLLLIQDGRELTFKVADPAHALAKRALSRISLPDGATVELHPFERRNLTANFDM